VHTVPRYTDIVYSTDKVGTGGRMMLAAGIAVITLAWVVAAIIVGTVVSRAAALNNEGGLSGRAWPTARRVDGSPLRHEGRRGPSVSQRLVAVDKSGSSLQTGVFYLSHSVD
jgi:hypothetical protein